jgi:hypothetical protein
MGVEATTGLLVYVQVAQVGAVAPQAGVEQYCEHYRRIYAVDLSPMLGEPGSGLELLLPLLHGKGVALVPVTWLEVTHRFQQATIKVGLGKIPGQLQPGSTPVGSSSLVPEGDVRCALGQRLDGLPGNLIAEGFQGGDDRRRIAIVGDDVLNDLRFPLGDGVAGERSRLGCHQ